MTGRFATPQIVATRLGIAIPPLWIQLPMKRPLVGPDLLKYHISP